MKKRIEEKGKGEQFSSSPMLTRQSIEINRSLSEGNAMDAFRKMWAIFRDLPEVVRERILCRTCTRSYERRKRPKPREDILDEFTEEENGQRKRKDGKENLNFMYGALTDDPWYYRIEISELDLVGELWMRMRDELKNSGLLADTREILTGIEK